MTAGRGIVHSERSGEAQRASGGPMHGLQLWLALRKEHEECAPSFQHADALPIVERSGVRARVLLGEFWGEHSRVEHGASPTLIDLSLAPGASLSLPAGREELAVYVVSGRIKTQESVVSEQELLVPSLEEGLFLEAMGPTRLTLLGGPALPERRYLDWNFVASTPALLARAKEAWRAFPAGAQEPGALFSKIPGDDREYIALP